jgi:hypothetical protein
MASITGSRPVSDLSNKLEAAANCATIIAALLLSFVLVRSFLLPTTSSLRRPTVRATNLVTVGTDLSKRIPANIWNKNERTLVLVLSTHCHFCTESAPFFRQVRERIGKDTKLVGVLPEPVAEAESYLSREGVNLDEIRQLSLSKVGVDGTPTMLLVNKNGVVMQTWVGKLGPEEQDQAMKTIAERTGS